ncbi:hypothetical protein GWI33_017414 [Rhynchophorus ferrugineus]|uniref:Uncharacterized protein n=1 Tax=Rhynchophorus ferrugineus TaxID=354439 RepID=A0A834IW48_RHYFE|nr:hypothetical protein GWI33_017414 [Rhynchophorus ferrugineus]
MYYKKKWGHISVNYFKIRPDPEVVFTDARKAKEKNKRKNKNIYVAGRRDESKRATGVGHDPEPKKRQMINDNPRSRATAGSRRIRPNLLEDIYYSNK